MIQLVIAVKSSKLLDLHTAFNFIKAVCSNSNVQISMIFFYQNAVNCLFDLEAKNLAEFSKLLNKYDLTIKVCKSACKKRGLQIKNPFVASTIIEFLNYCNNADRIIQF